jgi:hypothetical protein
MTHAGQVRSISEVPVELPSLPRPLTAVSLGVYLGHAPVALLEVWNMKFHSSLGWRSDLVLLPASSATILQLTWFKNGSALNAMAAACKDNAAQAGCPK